MNGYLGVGLAVLSAAVVAYSYEYYKNKKLWNKGTCSKCNTPWEIHPLSPTVLTCKCGITAVTFKRVLR